MKVNSRWILLGGALVLAIAVYAVAVYFPSGSGAPNNSTDGSNHIVQKIEVIHFHATQQCISCILVGSYAEETVNTCFQDEVSSGKLVFWHINGELPENRQLAAKYGATESSLWLGIYDETGFHPAQNINVWFKIENQTEYVHYLRGVISETLEGNYSWISAE